MERVLYNSLISGVSMEGDCFFYQNPLESRGRYERSPWFEVACCPGNIVRFIPSFPGYVYAEADGNLYVNLFVQSQANIELENQTVKLQQETLYPWEGNVKITVHPEKEKEFAVLVRIPGWAQDRPVPSDLYRFLDAQQEKIILLLNGEPYPLEIQDGYARLSHKWRPGDRIELSLSMPVRMVLSHENVRDNLGKAALQRGPIVYCLEEADNAGRVLDLSLPDDSSLESEFHPDLLGGVVVVKGQPAEQNPFTAVPYYAWAHRGAGKMIVWIDRE